MTCTSSTNNTLLVRRHDTASISSTLQVNKTLCNTHYSVFIRFVLFVKHSDAREVAKTRDVLRRKKILYFGENVARKKIDLDDLELLSNHAWTCLDFFQHRYLPQPRASCRMVQQRDIGAASCSWRSHGSIIFNHVSALVDYIWLPINTRMVRVVTGDVTGDYPLLRH